MRGSAMHVPHQSRLRSCFPVSPSRRRSTSRRNMASPTSSPPAIRVRDLLSRAYLSIENHRIADPAGVHARYLDLRLTSSELLVGCGKTTVRYPLPDLAAHVEAATDGNSIYLLIDGPGFAIRRPLQYQLDSRAGARAWKFAQAVNYVASDRGSIRAACAWVDAHGINWPQRRPPLLPRRKQRVRRERTSKLYQLFRLAGKAALLVGRIHL